jgi:hypothetical protein
VRIELLKEGWNRVPIRLGDVAISRAVIGANPARLVPADGGYALIVENPSKTPQIIALDLEFARAYTKSPGRNSVSFEAPVAPVSRWDIRIPEPGVKVDVQPLLAASEVPVAKDATETHVQAFVGATPSVRIEWTPKSEGAKGLTALASVQSETRVTIDEGVTRTRAELEYAVSRAELPQVRVEVPADQKIVNVFDPNVREWSVAAEEGRSASPRSSLNPRARNRSWLSSWSVSPPRTASRCPSSKHSTSAASRAWSWSVSPPGCGLKR